MRIDGSGGDGGVEAIWNLNDGRKIGYQAKYFLSLGCSQWTQMDKSVQRALCTHPELKTYIFALPRDLTHRTSTKTQHSSQWEKWGKWKKKWAECARQKGINVEFELWSKSDIHEKLLCDENITLARHWFGGDVLNNSWFREHIRISTGTLDDRFNPDDHVDVEIESLFDTIARGPRIETRIDNVFSRIMKLSSPFGNYRNAENILGADAFSEAKAELRKLICLRSEFQFDHGVEWNLQAVRSNLHRLLVAIEDIRSRWTSAREESTAPDQNALLHAIRYDLQELMSACYNLRKLLGEPQLRAEATRCALVHGPAGAGKSHVFGNIAQDRTSAGLPTVLVLGQSISNQNFWEQIGGQLGFERRTAIDVLGTLNAAGERRGKRAMLLFDAINEGVGISYWKRWFVEIVESVQRFPYLVAVFSCRDEFINYVVPQKLRESLPLFKIEGFSDPEEMERAAVCYLDKKGISRPSWPLHSPEFRNPLFLKSASDALQRLGQNEFPLGLRGMSQLMSFYIEAIGHRISPEITDIQGVSSSLKRLVSALANQMVDCGSDFVEISNANDIVNGCFKDRPPPNGKTWLNTLFEAGLLRRDPSPSLSDANPLDPPTDLVRFAFQRFQDHLMAQFLVSKLNSRYLRRALGKGGRLNHLIHRDNNGIAIKENYAGLVGALSTIYPEKFGTEFAETVPQSKQFWKKDHTLRKSFVDSCKWRKVDAFSEHSKKMLSSLSATDFWEVLFETSVIADHPWNALYLHSILDKMSMSERDSSWTQWINETSMSSFNHVERIVSWAQSPSARLADTDHLELTALVLGWTLTSSRLTLRDNATKALTSVFLADPDVFLFVINKMRNCNDPYVIERLYASAFGACCIDRDPKRLNRYSSATFVKIFLNRSPPVALLTRDYALGIIELAESIGVLSDDVSIQDRYPPFGSAAPKFGLTYDNLVEIANKHGGQQIHQSASGEGGDYGKYSIPLRVRNFLSTSLPQVKPRSAEEIKGDYLLD